MNTTKKEIVMMSIEEKQILLGVRNDLSALMGFLIPDEISVPDLARQLQKDSSTILKYIKNSFEPNKDYYQRTKGGTMYVRREAMLQTRMHYGK